MTERNKTLVTRADIAQWLDCTERMVADNERRWGLEAARRDLNARNVRYHAEMARRILAGPGRPLR